MPVTKDISSKADFEAAVNGNPGKIVLIYAYIKEADPRAEAAAEANQDKPIVPYSTDVTKNVEAAKGFDLTKDELPAFIAFKDGSEIKRVSNLNDAKIEEFKTFLSGAA